MLGLSEYLLVGTMDGAVALEAAAHGRGRSGLGGEEQVVGVEASYVGRRSLDSIEAMLSSRPCGW